jgi:hypothetical protein
VCPKESAEAAAIYHLLTCPPVRRRAATRRSGLFASFIIAIVISFTGGRPAMISDAAGSVALTYSPLNLLACALQLLFGPLRRGAARRRLQGHTRRLEVRNVAPEQRVRQFSAARTSSSVGKRPVTFFE